MAKASSPAASPPPAAPLSAAARPEAGAEADGEQLAGRRRRGMSLAVKYGLIIGALLAGLAIMWGVLIIFLTWAVLDRQIFFVSLWGLGCVLLGAVVAYRLARMSAQPIRDLVADKDVVGRGNPAHETRPHAQDAIGLSTPAFNLMTRSIRRARVLEREAERMNAELATAREIQTALLPRALPPFPGGEIEAFYSAAREVGGDFYDVFRLDQEHLALVVADVSGKGIPGALLMSGLRTALRILARASRSPAEVLRRANRAFAGEMPPGMFVTVQLAILNQRARLLKVASAGHNPLYLWRAASGRTERIKPRGIAIGFDLEIDSGSLFDKTLAEQEVTLEPGDRLLAYTDGVTEAMNVRREEFGAARLLAFLREHRAASSGDFVRALVAELERHRGAAEQHDDITIVTLRVS